ncbi:uncharacterized protein NECHADRAFT_76543 [Fusarium vanettenii 77-13-4]|uniref:Uncharacterized protein n=1 Tax=Fusarium vanettenii (strain ATCC MYA-4622 / CBS 123669 / FGSC 9596 / NRRL 45880 / 77-13-4) TaxID=660122 RepID=C7Z4J4_FUSV7|nr:uncharacterized protein NECHADRAFT_76543 [Fusarium vanettenii 77-13-4]EEU40934.1 predicted protein [Fusarium vanettenii 77-13-4]
MVDLLPRGSQRPASPAPPRAAPVLHLTYTEGSNHQASASNRADGQVEAIPPQTRPSTSGALSALFHVAHHQVDRDFCDASQIANFQGSFLRGLTQHGPEAFNPGERPTLRLVSDLQQSSIQGVGPRNRSPLMRRLPKPGQQAICFTPANTRSWAIPAMLLFLTDDLRRETCQDPPCKDCHHYWKQAATMVVSPNNETEARVESLESVTSS